MKKIFALAPAADNPWYSCRVIEEGMIQALSGVAAFEVCRIQGNMSEELIERIQDEAQALFVGSTPLLTDLADQISELTNIPLVIPIFGDMTIETRLWIKLGQSLKGRPITFLGASTRQCQQLEKFIMGASIKKLPYPLPAFWFSPLIEQERKEVKLVYSGRLTPQKNVLELMHCFVQVLTLRPEMELHIAGNFHEMGYHFHGIFHDPKDYELRFFELVKKSQGKIIYHGFLSQTDLKNLYEKSDVFVSLSTYHDEDFGVSVAQAIARGMRAVLSDWGGHGDFAGLGLAQLCKVEVDHDNVPRPLQNSVIKLLSSLTGNTVHAQRCAYQKKLNDYINQEDYSDKLVQWATSMSQVYLGQRPLFLDYAIRSEKQYVYSREHGEENRKMYHDIYDSYLVTNMNNKTWS